MEVRLDPARIDAHVAALHEEIAELRACLDEAARLQREAALDELLERLAPALGALGRVVARGEADRGSPAGEATAALVTALTTALGALGLEQVRRRGEVLELWPEQARGRIELDRPLPEDATLVRVEVIAPGYSRGELTVAPPLGRVIEVIP